MARQALGKGLDALIPGAKKYRGGAKGISELRIFDVKPNPQQPRKTFTPEKMSELINSVKERGVITPIIVRETGGKYEIVAGERRFIAAQRAGLKTIPAIIKNVTATEQLALAITENIQREDLNPVEEARGYKNLMEIKGFTQEKLADELGRNRATVANLLRLLKLPDSILKYIVSGEITGGHAKLLLGTENKNRQKAVAEQIVRRGLTVRETEKMLKQGPKKKKTGKTSRQAEMKEIEKKLRNFFGTKAVIKGDYNKGRIEVEYYSKENFESILDVLNIKL